MLELTFADIPKIGEIDRKVPHSSHRCNVQLMSAVSPKCAMLQYTPKAALVGMPLCRTCVALLDQ